MKNPGLRQRVLRGFFLFSIVQFFLLVALAIYSFHYGEDQALSRLVTQKPAVWREYQSIDDIPEMWRREVGPLKAGTHELSGEGLNWLEGREMHVHVTDNGEKTWRIVQFEEGERSLAVISIYGLFALLATALLVLFGGWAAWLIADRVSRPLELLAEKVGKRDTNSTGPLLAGAVEDGEVALLGRTLDLAFARVDAAIQRETTLSRNISHELRTPLTVISTSLHGADDPDPLFRDEALERARRACGEMELLTTACLELSREPVSAIADGVYERGIASVANTTKQIVRESLHLVEGRDIEVDVSVENGHEQVRASESLVRLAVGNAVRNALIHGDAGHVQITVTAQHLTIENPVDPGASSQTWWGEHRGQGFGLNILGQTCERLGWEVEFIDAFRGRIAVRFHFAST